MPHIWKWYGETQESLNGHKIKILNAQVSGEKVSDLFFGMTREEAVDYFQEHKNCNSNRNDGEL